MLSVLWSKSPQQRGNVFRNFSEFTLGLNDTFPTSEEWTEVTNEPNSKRNKKLLNIHIVEYHSNRIINNVNIRYYQRIICINCTPQARSYRSLVMFVLTRLTSRWLVNDLLFFFFFYSFCGFVILLYKFQEIFSFLCVCYFLGTTF